MISHYRLLTREIEKHLDGWITCSNSALKNMSRFNQEAVEKDIQRAMEHDMLVTILTRVRCSLGDDRSVQDRMETADEDQMHAAYYTREMGALNRRLRAQFGENPPELRGPGT